MWRHARPPSAVWRRYRHNLRRAIAKAIAIERDRWPFLIPIAYGTGIAVYFTWTLEPAPWLAATAAAVALSVAWVWRRRGMLGGAGIVIAALALGHGIADLR